jgi:glycosyltransferase involved in cell wall biosynthesis
MLGAADERLKVGVWRVAVNLLTELGKIDKKNTYRLYSFTPIPQELMRQFGARMENRVLAPGTGWMSVRLPLEFMLRTPDVFLGLAQAVPRWGGKSIGFVYDLGFLHHPQAYPDSHAKLAAQTRKAVKRAQKIITISQATKADILQSYDVSASKIQVAYPGVATPFRVQGMIKKAKMPYFLFVGALKRGKNVPVLLRAFATFQKQTNVRHELLLIGSNYWMDPLIEETIRELQIGTSVITPGYVSDEALATYYRGATALVIPSLVEGFCLPAVEAMACGTPVIASGAGSLPEIVGKGGIVIASQDPKKIAAAMEKVASDEEYRNTLVKEAVKQAQKFDWETFAKTVLSSINA